VTGCKTAVHSNLQTHGTKTETVTGCKTAVASSLQRQTVTG